MKTLINILAVIAFAVCCYLGGCNYHRVDALKAEADSVFESSGFRVVAYEGYQIGNPCSPGGKVWFVIERRSQPGVLYNCYISYWSGESHIYNLNAINALSAH